jgi:hypothetical protein
MKHVVFNYRDTNSYNPEDYNSGRVAVGVTGARLIVKRLAGNPPMIQILPHILDLALPEGWKDSFEEEHQNRKYPWLVERRGYSYLLRYLRDKGTYDCPVGGRLHVSMEDKLNQDLDLWVGDVNPLLAAALTDYQVETDLDRISLELYDAEESFRKLTEECGSFNSPAYASGLGDNKDRWAEIAARYNDDPVTALGLTEFGFTKIELVDPNRRYRVRDARYGGGQSSYKIWTDGASEVVDTSYGRTTTWGQEWPGTSAYEADRVVVVSDATFAVREQVTAENYRSYERVLYTLRDIDDALRADLRAQQGLAD